MEVKDALALMIGSGNMLIALLSLILTLVMALSRNKKK